MTILVSAAWNEVAWDGVLGGKRSGVFTYYLTQGLATKVADRKKKGIITIADLFEYARMRTAEEVGIQHAKIYKGYNPNMVVLSAVN